MTHSGLRTAQATLYPSFSFDTLTTEARHMQTTTTKIELPQVDNYGQYSSANYGVNTLKLYIGNVTLWFSYRTLVAFQVCGSEKVIRHNDWGQTTGKHLNWIDPDHSVRLSGEEFENQWNQQVSGELPTL